MGTWRSAERPPEGSNRRRFDQFEGGRGPLKEAGWVPERPPEGSNRPRFDRFEGCKGALNEAGWIPERPPE
eukprot:2940912-Pyramimonas_sp.AAC.1